MHHKDQNNVNIERFPQVMIHACNAREWYVYDYLVPSLIEQGLPQSNIVVWHDYKKIGNLHSCLKSYQWCRWNFELDEGTWHLQDDVLISRDFVKRIIENDRGIVNGFCCQHFNVDSVDKFGQVSVKDGWNSYQCIRIPNYMAGQFHDWVYSAECLKQKKYHDWYVTGKMDDSFWREWLLQKNPDKTVINLAPALVQHIDMLIGGSVINDGRAIVVCRGCYWQDQESLRKLVEKLRRTGKLNEKYVGEYVRELG